MFNSQKIKKCIISVFIAMGTVTYANEPQVVPELNLSKYQGKWFEISRFPNPFQTKCQKNVSVKFGLLENGFIKVVNSCVQENGTTDSVKGLAKIQDPKSNAKLEVSFFDIFGWRPVWDDYWVLYIDANYQISVIGDRKQKYGWILSRSKSISKTQTAIVTETLDKNGYDSKKLLYTQHD
jgi:apolipoprotein D and lipocalin family protein